jgi:cobalt-precorrin 5A hydrolase/precorrin-3B C17-methyltransferase
MIAGTAAASVPPAAIVVLAARGAGLAGRLRAALGGDARVHAPACVDCPGAEVRFAKLLPHLQALFRDGAPIVGLCATGILVRALAPLIGDKRAEPPVVAVAEDGSAVVPLLGGHRGANRLALAIAAGLGGGTRAAVTTAGDLRLGLPLDEPPEGWTLANPEAARDVAARLLDGAPVRLEVEPGLEAAWLREAGLLVAADAALALRATWRGVVTEPGELVYHPRVLAIGVGCERGASPEALVGHVRATLAEAGLSPLAVGCVVSVDLKAAEPAVHAVAADLGAPARFFWAERLLDETPRLANPSEAAYRATGCWGVAEGAALAAAGPAGRLLVPKRIGAGVTCAVAIAPEPLDPARTGQARGRLSLVGLGPGGRAWRTAEAQALLDAADDIVGYGLYLDLAGPPLPGQRRHPFPIGAEAERCHHALELAAGGRDVALVCSGDPGIYALASLVMELLEREGAGRPEWGQVEVAVSPGVSALQAAAARAGAPLGHDFCAVSLSDLLTPWEAIERRLEAAAAADFVLALYNPVSARRQEGLVRARDILLRHRAAETPVVLARDLGREGEAVRTVTLSELEPGQVDMLTVVLVGSSTTRRVPRLHGNDWVYTPRGYGVER